MANLAHRTALPGSTPDDQRPPINAQWLERMRSIKPDFLRSLFDMFLAEEPKRILALGKAVSQCDLEQIRYMAHSVKGAAATMGMERLCDASRELERAAKDGEADLALCFAMVQKEIEAVYAVMREGR